MKKFFHSTIFTIPVSLIGWFLLFVLLLITAGLSNFNFNKRTMKSEKFAEMESISTLKYEQIVQWLNERRSEARFVKENPQFQRMFTDLMETPENQFLITEIKDWLNPIILNHKYAEIFLLDNQFQPVLVLSQLGYQILEHSVDKIKPELVKDTIITSDLFDIPDLGPGLFNIIPFFHPLNGEFCGSLVFIIDAGTQLYPLLLAPVMSETHETYLVKLESDSIYYNSPLRLSKYQPFKFSLPLDQKDLAISKYFYKGTFVNEGLDYRGKKVLTYVRQIDFSNLLLISEIDQEEIYEQIFKRARNTFVFITVLIFLAAFVIFYYWKTREVSYLRKITEGQEEKAAILRQYEHITKFANDIILLVNPKGRIIWGNEKAIQTYGYTINELTHLSILDLRTPESREQVAGFMQRVKEEGGLVFETMHVKKTGQRFPVEVSSRYLEVEGKFFYQSIIRDITERKASEEELYKKNEEIENFFNLAVDLLCIANQEGYFLQLNKSWENTLGYTLEELKNSRFLDFVHPEDIDKTLHVMKELNEDKEVVGFVNRYFTKDGSLKYIEWNSRQKGNLIYAAARDITGIREQEKALKLALQTLNYHINNNPMAVIEWDRNFRVTKWSAQAEIIFGWKATEVMNKRPDEWNFLFEEDEFSVNTTINDFLGRKIQRNKLQVRNYNKDKKILHCSWYNSVLLSDDGEIISILSLVQDETEQFITKTELERAYKRNTLLLETAGDGIMGLNEKGELVFINPAGEKILGYKESEFIGKSVHDKIHRPDEAYHENEKIDCPILNSLETGVSVTGFEDYFFTKGGKMVPVEYSSTPINEKNKVTGSVIVFKDISERKKQEVELIESRENLAITLVSIGDAVITTNDKGLITNMNPVAETLTGWKSAKAIGKPVEKVFSIRSAESGDHMDSPIKTVLETGKIVGLANHTELISKTGEVYQIADSAAPIRKDDGEIIGVVMVFRDVTEKYNQEKAIRESEEKFRSLFESADDGLFLIREDIIIDCNPASVKLFGGSSKNELTGKSVLELSPEYQLEGIKSQYLAKQYIQSALQGRSQNFEWKHTRLDGSILETEITLNRTKMSHGKIIQASIRDISKRKEAEQKLKQLADIFHNTKIGVVIGNAEGKYLDTMNPAFAEMHGYSVEELKGKEITSVFAEDEWPKIPEIIKLVHETGYHQFESYHVKKDGTVFPVLITLNAVKDNKGEVLYRIVNVQDITERKRAEEEIELLYEISQILNTVSDLDSAVEAVLEKICDVCDWDYGEAWFPHQSDKLLNHSRKYYSKSEDHKKFAEKSIEFTFKFGEGLAGRAWALKDLVWFKKISDESGFLQQDIARQAGFNSGFAIPVIVGKKLITVLVFFVKKLFDEDTKLIKLINSVTSHFGEVLQRKWAEGEIRKLSFALDQSPIAVEICNVTGVVEYVNQKYLELSGLQPVEVLGNIAGFLKLRETNREKYHELIETIRNGVNWSGELLNKTAEGEYFWEKLMIAPVADEKGVINHYISLREDISAQKIIDQELIKAKELAEEASRLKSTILTNMSHEIRTPLNGILGFSQLLKGKLTDEDDLMMVESINESGDRLMKTLSALVEIAQLDAQPKAELSEVNMYRLVEGVFEDFLMVAGKKKLYLKNDIPPGLTLTADNEKLSKVLKYTVDNAVKFTNSGGISVSFSWVKFGSKPGYAIQVADTGIGINKEAIPKLFEPFWQLSQGTERTYEGTGIGLSIVKKLITVMEGEVLVESEPGKGAIFHFSFPLFLDDQVEKPVTVDSKPEKIILSPDKKPKILIVEDNQINAKLMKMHLQECCESDLVSNGLSAIEKSRTNEYDLILMDINLGPGMDGVEATQEIRKIAGYSQKPIIAVTGYALPSDKEKFLKRGLSHLLPKPFTKEQIVNLVESFTRSIG